MAVTGGPSKYNVELNVIPFIDILSTCICFLLMTTVWLQAGAFNLSQATGAPTEESTQPKPLMHVRIDKNQDLALVFKDFPQGKMPAGVTLRAARGQMDLGQLKLRTGAIQKSYGEIQTVLIEPQAGVSYNEIVQVISVLKEANLKSIGLMPLSNEIAEETKTQRRRAGGGGQ